MVFALPFQPNEYTLQETFYKDTVIRQNILLHVTVSDSAYLITL